MKKSLYFAALAVVLLSGIIVGAYSKIGPNKTTGAHGIINDAVVDKFDNKFTNTTSLPEFAGYTFV